MSWRILEKIQYEKGFQFFLVEKKSQVAGVKILGDSLFEKISVLLYQKGYHNLCQKTFFFSKCQLLPWGTLWWFEFVSFSSISGTFLLGVHEISLHFRTMHVEKTSHCNSMALSIRKAPTKKIARFRIVEKPSTGSYSKFAQSCHAFQLTPFTALTLKKLAHHIT